MIYKTQNQFYSSKCITIPNKPRKISNNNMNISDLYSEVLSNSIVHTNTNTEDLYDYNDFSVDFSYIAGDIDDNIFHEKSFINSFSFLYTLSFFVFIASDWHPMKSKHSLPKSKLIF